MSENTKAWADLQALADGDIAPLGDMFAGDPQRAKNMSHRVGGLYVDFSKQRITQDIQTALLALAGEAKVESWRAQMFAGDPINTSENRAVLHPALRGSAGSVDVREQVEHMAGLTRKFSQKIRAEGRYKAVVHIGIGGSDLGPRLCAQAFSAAHQPELELRFAVNVDGAAINDALMGLDPETTLVIAVSKTFTTQETRMNAEAAKVWLGAHTKTNMIAVSANTQAAQEFGIAPDNIFAFWQWVGGRFSLWSAVSLSLQITYGPDVFDEFLAGAREMDEHFTSAPLRNNLPVLMALTAVWNRNFLRYPTNAVVPYAGKLAKLPAYLQQLEMESCGKSVTRDGQSAPATSPVIWGDEGSNGQHAFFQFLHQSRDITPVDFIGVLHDHAGRPAHHKALLANLIAQSEALMVGKKSSQPEKAFSGNRPSTTIVLDKLDARTLGSLIALYEHKVFVQSVLWNINAFDQWGVELGKVLATNILAELGGGPSAAHDSSTKSLIALARTATTD